MEGVESSGRGGELSFGIGRELRGVVESCGIGGKLWNWWRIEKNGGRVLFLSYSTQALNISFRKLI